MNILILHGVNLNMFGRRDPTHYGTATLADINAALADLARELGAGLATFQTNHEGEMVDASTASLKKTFRLWSSTPGPGPITAMPSPMPWPF